MPALDHRDALIQRVLRDPALLWEARSAPVVVLGPWVESREVRPDGTFGGGTPGGRWRRPPGHEGKILADGAIAHRSRSLESLRPHEPYDGSSYDEDALADYEVTCKVWKPFTYRVRVRLPAAGMVVEKKGYADTLEEAMAEADAVMRTHGILLVDGEG